MNSVSWFLYLAGVADRMSLGLIIFVMLGAFTLMMTLMFYFIENSCLYPYWKRHTAIIVAVAFLASIIPSAQTMYAIAASQIGEQVLKSEAVQGIASDATKALQQWIKKQIEPEKK